MRTAQLASVLLIALLADSAAAQVAPPPPATATGGAAAAAPAAAPETMVLQVTLNTEDKGDLFVARTADGDFLVKTQDLKALGLKDPAGSVTVLDGEPHISLRSMAGIGFVFQQHNLALAITVQPQLLPARSFGSVGDRRAQGAVFRDTSGFFNYALNYAKDSSASSTLGFAAEAGWRYGDYLLLADAATVQRPDGKRKLVRLMTHITRDDRDSLQRWVVGDFFTPAREFGGGILLGGISFSKLYSLNPYLIQFPTQSISGIVALPSDLEVYLDGQRIRTEKLKPGEFELRDILAYGGARSVQLVLRDAFGRVQQFDYSFYFSDRPLRQGLHEYSYNLGAFRRNFGSDSNRYGPPAYAMFHRYGWSNSLTLGLRAEGTRQLLNAGPSATVVLGSLGVLNLALAGSAIADRRGAAGSVGYNYLARNWSLGLSLRRDWGHYASLGDPVSITNRKVEASVVASTSFAGRGALSLSHSALTTYAGRLPASPTPAQPYSVTLLGKRRVTSLQYSVPLYSGRVSLSASLSHIKDGVSRNEAFVGLVFLLDKDYTATANVRADRSNDSESFRFTKNQPIGEGLGYVLSADRSNGPLGLSGQLRSNLQYNAPIAILRGEFGQRRDQGIASHDLRLSAAGGVAYVGGKVALGRPVVDSFGIVKVGELPGVAVSVNGQPMGKTDGRGMLFVPTLSPYVDSDVSIASATVPIEYAIAATTRQVSPSLRSGAVIEFAVTKIQAFTGTLKLQDQTALRPVEFREVTVRAPAPALSFQTGRGGEFYLENWKPGSYGAAVNIDGKACLFELVIPDSPETFVELPESVCRPRP